MKIRTPLFCMHGNPLKIDVERCYIKVLLSGCPKLLNLDCGPMKKRLKMYTQHTIKSTRNHLGNCPCVYKEGVSKSNKVNGWTDVYEDTIRTQRKIWIVFVSTQRRTEYAGHRRHLFRNHGRHLYQYPGIETPENSALPPFRAIPRDEPAPWTQPYIPIDHIQSWHVTKFPVNHISVFVSTKGHNTYDCLREQGCTPGNMLLPGNLIW